MKNGVVKLNNKVVNKQISIKSIIDVANYIEDYKEKYDKIFQDEEAKNKDKSFGEKNMIMKMDIHDQNILLNFIMVKDLPNQIIIGLLEIQEKQE